MADKKENEEGKTKEKEVEKKDVTIREKNPIKLKLLSPAVVFVIILLGAFGLTKYALLPLSRKYQINKQIKEKILAGENKIPEMGLVYVIDDLTINILGSSGYRIIAAELTLESKEKDVIKEIEAREPQLRDMFIEYFRSRKADEISNISFQEESRSELIKIVNEHLNSGVIDSLYYVRLILQ